MSHKLQIRLADDFTVINTLWFSYLHLTSWSLTFCNRIWRFRVYCSAYSFAEFKTDLWFINCLLLMSMINSLSLSMMTSLRFSYSFSSLFVYTRVCTRSMNFERQLCSFCSCRTNDSWHRKQVRGAFKQNRLKCA